MTESEQRWLDQGRGLSPEWTWSFTADAPLVGLELARESGDTIVADASDLVVRTRNNIMPYRKSVNAATCDHTGVGGWR